VGHAALEQKLWWLFSNVGSDMTWRRRQMDLPPVPFILLAATICSATFFTAIAVLASF
jgi:hypothetical protein